MIEFRNVEKRYPDGTLAVERLDLEIPRARTTVFVGPSGCGKTTSLRMINRMIEPSSGSIIIDGVDASTIPRGRLRRGIGYVIQSAGLFPHRSVLHNIMTVPRLNGVPKANARERAMQLMHTVGLPTSLAGKFPAQLSGGQQQRVGVARALAAEPKVLLMDEPFSALDPVVRSELQDEFKRLGPELGTTIVFVTHDIDEAVKLGDQIAVFEPGGRLAQFATPEDLLAAPASEFVARFVGRDRGYRALSFRGSSDIPFEAVPQVRVGSPSDSTNGWKALVSEAEAFLGWLPPDAQGRSDAVTNRGGSFRQGASMRTVLDAVLMSPAGTAVCLDEGERVVGGVTMDSLMRAGLGQGATP